MEIKIEENQIKGFAIATDNEISAEKMTYSIPSSDFIIISYRSKSFL